MTSEQTASPLTHYIVVRHDLPLGVVAAMITHAAGESFYFFARSRSSAKEHRLDKPEGGGSSPSGIASIKDTRAVVLRATDGGHLIDLLPKLKKLSLAFVLIEETEGIYAGQPMAIGLHPVVRTEEIRKMFNGYQLLNEVKR